MALIGRALDYGEGRILFEKNVRKTGAVDDLFEAVDDWPPLKRHLPVSSWVRPPQGSKRVSHV